MRHLIHLLMSVFRKPDEIVITVFPDEDSAVAWLKETEELGEMINRALKRS